MRSGVRHSRYLRATRCSWNTASARGSAKQAVTPLPHHVLDSLAAQTFVDRSGTWRKPPLCSKLEEHLWNEFKALLPYRRAPIPPIQGSAPTPHQQEPAQHKPPRGAARSRRAAAARTPPAALCADLEALRAVLWHSSRRLGDLPVTNSHLTARCKTLKTNESTDEAENYSSAAHR